MISLLIRDLSILAALLLFELWNVCTAKRRGSIFVSLWAYDKGRTPKDFKVAFWLNIGWTVVILLVIILRVRDFLVK